MKWATLAVLVAIGGSARAEEPVLKEMKSREFAKRVEILVAAKDDVLALTPHEKKDGVLVLMSVADGKVRREFEEAGRPLDADAAGKVLAFGKADGTILVYDLSVEGEPRKLKAKSEICSLSVSSDGQFIAATLADKKSVELWTLATGKSAAVPIEEDEAGVLEAGTAGFVATCRFDAPRVEVYDAVKGKELKDLSPTDQPIGQMEFSQDGRKLLTTGIAGIVRLWDVKEGKLELDLSTLGQKHSIFSAHLSPDATLMVTSELNGTIAVWDTDGKLKVETKAYPKMQPGRIVRFLSPTRFATCCDPGYKTIIWEYSPGK